MAQYYFRPIFFGRHPGAQIIATAHTASLADHFGRKVRSVLTTHGAELNVSLARDSRAAGRFSLEDGGAYFAAGVRGPITGRRADLILIDDPVKSWAEAESPAYREALYDWYRAELTARLKPNGRIVLMMTRWHEDDLAGRLMRAEGRWQSLTLPALAKAEDMLGRVEGEALWPAWQNVEALARRRAEVGERAFSAMYQQNPRPPEAALFNTKTIRIIAQSPLIVRSIRAWDLAATLPTTGRDPDYTVGLKIGVTMDNMIVVLDIIRLQATPGQVENAIAAAAKADGPNTIIALPQDPGQAGLAQVTYLKRNLAGYPILSTTESGAKITRAMPAAAQMDAANILLLAAPWNENFLSELSAFPDSQKDDQVDAFSRAVGSLATSHHTATHQLNVPFFWPLNAEFSRA